MLRSFTANSSQLKTNVTSRNSTNFTSFGPVELTFNYATLLTSFAIIFCEIVAVGILRKCKRMPYSSRILSTSFILSDAAGALTFAVHQIIILIFGINNDITHNSRTLAVGAMLTISWASIASMSVERVVALKANIKYTMSYKKTRVRVITSSLWLAHIALASGIILVGFKQHCDWNLNSCDIWKASKVSRFVMMGFLVLYEIILIISYVIIHGIATRHAKDIAAVRKVAFGQTIRNPDTVSERQFSTTEAIIKIVFAFLLLHTPLVIHLFIFENDFTFRHETPRRILHAFSYMCIQLNSFVSLRLYVVKFDECKLYFFQLLSRLFSSFDMKAGELRLKVFNIVVSSEYDRTCHA